MLKNALLLLLCCASFAACGKEQAEEETSVTSPTPTAQVGFSQKIDAGGPAGELLPLAGKAFGELSVVGEEDAVYCNLPENVRSWDDIIPLCTDPLYGILYYMDYGGDFKIHAIYNGESHTVLDLPGKRLFCRGGKLYFLLESYHRFGFEGAKSGNIAEYDPVTGEVRILSDKVFTSMVVYQDMIYCKCQGTEEGIVEDELYTSRDEFWFYFFDTQEFAERKSSGREYILDFRRYGEYFLAVSLEEYEEDPRYDVQAGTELRKWDGERGTFWNGLIPSGRHYVKEGNLYWLDSKGFHEWNLDLGEDSVRPWKLGKPDQYILVGEWLLSQEYKLVNTEEGNVENWNSADEKFKVIHELCTDGEKIYAIVRPFGFEIEVEQDGVFRQVQVVKEEMGYELQFLSVKK